jgi:hypothetical protein
LYSEYLQHVYEALLSDARVNKETLQRCADIAMEEDSAASDIGAGSVGLGRMGGSAHLRNQLSGPDHAPGKTGTAVSTSTSTSTSTSLPAAAASSSSAAAGADTTTTATTDATVRDAFFAGAVLSEAVLSEAVSETVGAGAATRAVASANAAGNKGMQQIPMGGGVLGSIRAVKSTDDDDALLPSASAVHRREQQQRQQHVFDVSDCSNEVTGYNLILTAQYMMLVPRSQNAFQEAIHVNSFGTNKYFCCVVVVLFIL